MTSVELPEFDAEDPVWVDLLWSAARHHDQSIVALVEHCRRHDAEPVLRWLADGPGAYRWLAGRLLVEGVPAGEEHTAAFVASLSHSLRGDLRMTHLAAADFLDLATQIPAVRETLDAALQGAAWNWSWSLGPAIATALAVHDPETVARIAQEMLADPGTKGSARISAAGVLAKADERHVAEAVDTIRAVAATDHHAHRWHAVEVLVDLAPQLTGDLVDQVAEMLRDVLRTGALPPTQVAVARLLTRLGPRYTTEAVRMLRYLPPGEDDGREGEGRAEAARGLLEVDPPHTEEAIALLREVLADHYPSDQLHAATTLGGLGPQYEDEAADAARAVAHTTRHAAIRVAAARTLAGLGRRHAAEAAEILRAVLADTAQSDPDAGRAPTSLARTPRPDTAAAAELAALGPPYTAEAAGILRTMIPGPIHPADAYRNISAARALANIGPQHLDEATGALRRLLAGSALAPCPRVRVVQALAELDQRHDDDITAALRAVAADSGSIKPSPLAQYLRALARDHPRHTATVADTLGAVLLGAATRQTPSARGALLGAVATLTELSAGHPAAMDVLRAVIKDPTDVSEQIGAAVMLTQLDPPAIRKAIELLVAQITDPGAGTGDGGKALVKLKSLGRDHRDRVVDAMRQLLVSPRVDACIRIRTALDLAELDQWYDDDVTIALRTVAADPRTDEPASLMSWLDKLVRERPRHTSDAAGILRALLADPRLAGKAASALAALGPEYAAEALQTPHEHN